MNIKTKLLMNKNYIEILKNELGYSNIKIINMEIIKKFNSSPERLIDYIRNQAIKINYHLLADEEELYVKIIKKGIYINGNSDYIEVNILNENAEILYCNNGTNNIKKRKKKR